MVSLPHRYSPLELGKILGFSKDLKSCSFEQCAGHPTLIESHQKNCSSCLTFTAFQLKRDLCFDHQNQLSFPIFYGEDYNGMLDLPVRQQVCLGKPKKLQTLKCF